MKISNIRLEHSGDKAYLLVDVSCDFSDERTFWFSLPKKYQSFFATDVYDAFLISFLYPAMCYNEDIEIDGYVSKKLYKNIIEYVYSIILGYRPKFHRINIKVKGFASAKQLETWIIGTGYSGGVDSFATIVDHYANETDLDYKINSLFFFHLGQYGDINDAQTETRATNRYMYCKNAADFMGLPYIYLDTNMFAFYEPRWEYYAGVFTRAAAILTLQRTCRRYYVSGAMSFCQYAESKATSDHDFAMYADPIVWPLLSTEVCDIVIDGCQYRRVDKINIIKDYIPAQKYLNVCINCDNNHTEANNCGICGKCLRTLFALDALGAIDKFSNIFDTDLWEKKKTGYILGQRYLYGKDIFATENIDMYRNSSYRVPTYLESLLYVVGYTYPKKAINKILRIIKKQKFR